MSDLSLSLSRTVEEITKEINNIACELEKNIRGKVLYLIFHDCAYITRDVVDDLEFFVDEKFSGQIREDLYLILHTLGGDADAAYHLGVRLQSCVPEDRKVFMIVPRYAKSAGTLLACAANEVLLTPIAELGPIDPQIHVPETGRWISARAIAGSLRQVIETLREVGIKDPQVVRELLQRIPIVELGHYDSLVDHVQHLAEDLLKRRMFKEEPGDVAREVAGKLVRSYKYHGQVIHVEEAKRIGLKVRTLEGETLQLVYKFYRSIRKLFDSLNELLRPFLSIIEESRLPAPVEKCETDHGLIYYISLK